jgi:hypothetical protein
MKSTIFTTRAARWVRNILGVCLLLVVLSVAYSQLIFLDDKEKTSDKGEAASVAAKLPVEPGAVEVAFTDGSNLKMLLRDEKITLATPHGRLVIAVNAIRCIQFATRVSEEDSKRIGAAIADLGSAEFRKREAAGVDLLKLREKAYPALLRAAEQKDPEVVRRARELLQQIAAGVPAERLEIRKQDVVWTAESMIAGHIDGVLFKAHTSQFGDVQVKLADMRRLHSQAIEPEQAEAIMSASYGRARWNGATMRKGASGRAAVPTMKATMKAVPQKLK